MFLHREVTSIDIDLNDFVNGAGDCGVLKAVLVRNVVAFIRAKCRNVAPSIQ